MKAVTIKLRGRKEDQARPPRPKQRVKRARSTSGHTLRKTTTKSGVVLVLKDPDGHRLHRIVMTHDEWKRLTS